ncbi:MAG: hypothetical protein ACKO3V_09080 [Pirellula sp.]
MDSSTSLTNTQWVSPNRITSGFIDCQSHLFFPEVIELMRKRKTDSLVYDREGTTYLKMGDWLRKVPPLYLSVEAKLASMDKSGIAVTLLSNNDPAPNGSIILGYSQQKSSSRFAAYSSILQTKQKSLPETLRDCFNCHESTALGDLGNFEVTVETRDVSPSLEYETKSVRP